LYALKNISSALNGATGPGYVEPAYTSSTRAQHKLRSIKIRLYRPG